MFNICWASNQIRTFLKLYIMIFYSYLIMVLEFLYCLTLVSVKNRLIQHAYMVDSQKHVSQGLPANHIQVVVLLTSGHYWPSAADEKWYSPKRPSSREAIQHSSGSSVQWWVAFFPTVFIIPGISVQMSKLQILTGSCLLLPLSRAYLATPRLDQLAYSLRLHTGKWEPTWGGQ